METVWIIVGLLAVTLIVLNFAVRRKIKNIPVQADHQKILTLTDKNMQAQIKNKLVLVDFWAPWCAPCKMMAPILNELAPELNDQTIIGKVNVDDYQSLAKQYNIRSIPTLILLKNGVEVSRFSGVKSKDFLWKEIQMIK